jgi:hypothetical protein
MSDIGFIFSMVSLVCPDFRNIWYSPIIPYNLIGVYRVEQIMEISDFNRRKKNIHMYLENNINVHNEFLRLSVEDTIIIMNKIGNTRKNMDMRNVQVCKVCNKTYKTKSGYDTHISATNGCLTSNKDYSCIFCNQLFTTITNVRKHYNSCEFSIKNHIYLTKLNSKNKNNIKNQKSRGVINGTDKVS